MEFLQSLLRRRFARAEVATSGNVSCFLRLMIFHLPLSLLMEKVITASGKLCGYLKPKQLKNISS